ncbi:hypothetical protein, partial [Persicitalea sp.]|uniref:hypothetical protein n=1 Tax=Persicitalea sp. TaxID=3100273 RepID=UPI003593A96A
FLHDPAAEVFFPDSAFNFSPFEMIGQEYFTTRTDSLGSLDSTIYRLVSFDVAAIQVLRLPVFLLAARDCTAVYAAPDTLWLRSALPVTARPDTLLLRAETTVYELKRAFNYPIFMVFIGSVGLVVLVVYWLFGREIERQWRGFLLKRRHSEFVRAFNRLNRNARERNNTSAAEKAVVVWKEYLEAVEKKPFATYTTREIVDNIPDRALEDALKDIDRIIYGQGKSPQMDDSLQTLRNVAQRVYHRHRLEIMQLNAEKTAR